MPVILTEPEEWEAWMAAPQAAPGLLAEDQRLGSGLITH